MRMTKLRSGLQQGSKYCTPDIRIHLSNGHLLSDIQIARATKTWSGHVLKTKLSQSDTILLFEYHTSSAIFYVGSPSGLFLTICIVNGKLKKQGEVSAVCLKGIGSLENF